MSDAEREVVRLLTEIRDAQREDIAYRRQAVDESIVLQRRALQLQRTALLALPVLIVIGCIGLMLILSDGSRP
jgi:hypothetical protein